MSLLLYTVLERGDPTPTVTIVRFINRKNTIFSLKNKNKLRNTMDFKTIYINENLCPENRHIFNQLYKLKKSKRIHDVWVVNGTVKFTFSENDHYVKHVYHSDDIDYYLEEHQNLSV